MNVPDPTYRALRRLQLLTGVVPVGLFILSHFAINFRAVGGREAYQATVEGLARLPWLHAVEAVAIALPIAAHIALGWALGTTRQDSREPAYPSVAWRWLQRATGLYLSIYVVFHVWSVRLSPARLANRHPLFDLMAAQLAHPAVLALQGAAVLAAAAHFSGGVLALGGPHGFARRPAGRRALSALAGLSFVVLTAMGLSGLLAFVWPAARWLS
jgi:succinate dehydrogenase / fumarate reductase cytochrome b subunit